MKIIISSIFLIFTSLFMVVNAQILVSAYALPGITNVKYKDFNTFAESYNKVNDANIKLSRNTFNVSSGVDICYKFFCFGFNYNKSTVSSNASPINNFSSRQFDVDLKSYLFNIGVNYGADGWGGAYSFTPYMLCGLNYLDLDAYTNYFDGFKTYGNHKLDGTYSGTNMLFGYGIKVSYFYKIFYASLGFSQAFSLFPTASVHDFGSKGDALNGGYSDIGIDWAAYTSGNSWDYTGKYVSSSIRQTFFQLGVGLFFGKLTN